MTSYSALSPVSAAVYGALHVADLLALAPGGVGDDVAQGTAFPFLLYEVGEADLGSLGTRPGRRRTLEIALRLRVFSQHVGLSEAQAVMAKAIELLISPPAVTGYDSWAVLHDETVPVGRDIVAGVAVNELVANLRLFVTETS